MFNVFRINETVQDVIEKSGYNVSEKQVLSEAEKKLGKPVDEKKWSAAKAKTKSEYGGGLQKSDPGKFYSISMTIYKSMMGESEEETIKFKNQIEHIKDLIKTAPQEDKVKLRENLKLVQDRLKRAEGGKLDEAEEDMPGDTWNAYKAWRKSAEKGYGDKTNNADLKVVDNIIRKLKAHYEALAERDKKAKPSVKEAEEGDPNASWTGAGVEDEPADKNPAEDGKAGEGDEEDPTRDQLETAKDEKDEKKGGPAELSADLRVSIRIEQMNLRRYERMIEKNELADEDAAWLKEKIENIKKCIAAMEKKVPELEREAGANYDAANATEAMKAGIRDAIMEMASGKARTPDDHQKRICIDTVRNPMKGKILGGPNAEEAEKTLREKFHYTDKQIDKLKA